MSKKDKAPVYQLTPGAKLKALLTTARRVTKQVTKLSSELGAAVANAVEHHHLHRKAFSIIKQCNTMEPEHLAEFKAHFDHYWIEAGLQERADSVERLPLNDEKVVPIREVAE